MKLLIIILLYIFCFSCKSETEYKENYKIIITDKCEYIGLYDGNGYHYIHKVNCTKHH